MNTSSTSFSLAFALVGILIAAPGRLGAQDTTGDVSIRGVFSLDVNTYGMSSPSEYVPARRPTSLLRLRFEPTIAIGAFSLPLNLAFTIPESATRLAAGTGGELANLVRSPGNTFSAEPSFGATRLHLGTQSPSLSKLSGGDLQVFGAGVDVTAAGVRLAASAGLVGRPAAVDTTLGGRGAFERHAYAGRLAYAGDATEVGLNVVRVADAPSSLAAPTGASLEFRRLIPMPEESLTAALDAQFRIGSSFRIEAEAGASMYTRDMSAQAIPGSSEPLPLQRLSTRADGAGRIELAMVGSSWGVALGSTYVGPGYRTLARQWLEADRLDLTLSPRVELFDERLALSGTFGWRRNNLAATEEATTSQPLASINADARISESISLGAQYSNHGVRTPMRNDTLRVETVSQSLLLAPTITLASQDVTHVIALAASLDDYTDHNPITGRDGSNRIRSANAMYAATLAGLPVSADLSGSWLVNQIAAGDLTVATASLGAGARLLGGTVLLGARATLTRSWLDDAAADDGLTLRLTANWRVIDALRLRLDASTTGYTYASRAAFREHLLRTSLQFEW